MYTQVRWLSWNCGETVGRASCPCRLEACATVIDEKRTTLNSGKPVRLTSFGVSVTEVESASEALNRLRQADFDLLISDIGVPDLDGYALVRQIRVRSPDQGSTIPAIALTAYAGEMDQQQALAAGFQPHLTQPIEPERLMQTIWALVSAA